MITRESLVSLPAINKIESSKMPSKLKVEVDNRQLSKESLFVAIIGNRFNPLEHLDKVIESGCEFVVCEKSDLCKAFENKINFIYVEDINKAIADLGKSVADDFKTRGGKLIAISGSNGKTTTKEMIFHMVREIRGDSSVVCTQKNNNNHLGVPFSLFQIKESTQIAIIELGSNAPGEIEFLCKILNPQYGITTNIGDTHLEFFQNQENVFIEESVLHKYCSECFYVNADDHHLKQLLARGKSFGASGKDYKFTYNDNSIEVNGVELKNTHITGAHNLTNLAVAFSILLDVLECEKKDLANVASSFKPTANRSQWLEYRNTQIYLDAYNANPSSMRVALKGFKDFLLSKQFEMNQACLVVGDMNELGENTSRLHAETATFIESLAPATVYYVGRYFEDFQKGLTNKSLALSFETSKELAPVFNNDIAKHKFYFIKGSRSLQLEAILDIK